MSLTKKKHDISIFRDYIRSDSEKRDIEKKQKVTFLLISTNKDSLCLGIHSIILWSFSKIMVDFLKTLMKTADVNRHFLAIFERSYYDLYMYPFLWLSMSLSPFTDSLVQDAWKHHHGRFFYKKSTPNGCIWGFCEISFKVSIN